MFAWTGIDGAVGAPLGEGTAGENQVDAQAAISAKAREAGASLFAGHQHVFVACSTITIVFNHLPAIPEVIYE